MVGDFVKTVYWRICHSNASSGGGGDIDIIYPYAKTTNDLAVIQTLNDFSCDLTICSEYTICIGCDFKDFFWC